jgi:hypothetical protein
LLVVGRNRLRACELAGIEPRIEKRDLNGHDARALIVSLNVARRNLKAGQKAMAYAMIYPEPEKGGRGKKGKVPETSGFSRQRLGEARAVYAHSRELAHDVLRDITPLDDALKAVKAAREKSSSVEARCARKRPTSPGWSTTSACRKMKDAKPASKAGRARFRAVRPRLAASIMAQFTSSG